MYSQIYIFDTKMIETSFKTGMFSRIRNYEGEMLIGVNTVVCFAYYT